MGTSAALLLLATITAGCGRPSAGSIEPTPTYIPQPTPDPTMSSVIQGNGPQVAFLPPMEVRGSPTPMPAVRSAPATGGSRPAPKPAATARGAAPPAREAAPPAREAAPPARPAPTSVP